MIEQNIARLRIGVPTLKIISLFVVAFEVGFLERIFPFLL